MIEGYTLEELEKRIGYKFNDITLLKQAITHTSYTNEQKINKQKHYERLEFLGDAVLELLSSRFLFETYPDKPEGQLTKMRASMVCESSLAFCAKDLELGKFLLLGKGEEGSGGRERDSIVADVIESVLGAIYLDGGLEKANEYVQRILFADLENKQLFFDSKSNLQEYIQAHSQQNFSYELLEESGPEHDKVFVVGVNMDGELLGKGSGKTKKAAEQQAAYEALLCLRAKNGEGNK